MISSFGGCKKQRCIAARRHASCFKRQQNGRGERDCTVEEGDCGAALEGIFMDSRFEQDFSAVGRRQNLIAILPTGKAHRVKG